MTEIKWTDLHPFERANLGVAPFRCVGMIEKVIRYPDGTTQASGSCDYCGTGIRYAFRIRSSDGREFVVGSDCVAKTAASFDPSLAVEVRRLETARLRAQRDAKREASWQKASARAEAARALLLAHPALFADRPHPFPGLAAEGRTLRDYHLFCLGAGGVAGRTRAARAVEVEAAVAALACGPST